MTANRRKDVSQAAKGALITIGALMVVPVLAFLLAAL